MTEKDCKRKRKKTKKCENFEERSPLQNLNGHPIKRNTTKCSDFSSSSSSSAPAASRFLLSDNHCSSSSFFSSRTHLDKKPNPFSKIAKKELNKSRVHTSNVVPRSKENETPRKPFLRTSRKEKPLFITQRQNRQRSKLASVQSKSESKMMKGSREFDKNMENSEEIDSGKFAFELNRVSNGSNSNCAEICTPMSGNASRSSLNICDDEFVIEEDSVYERANANGNANSATDVKTPPVEASLSPEIQCHSQSKMLVLRSVGTPVCYGAGHLVSGVSDKRKYRRRGSLRGGPEKAILFSDARRDKNENVAVDMQESSIPLPAEASVRWHLSPHDVGREDHRIDLDQGRVIVCDDDFLLCAKSSYSGNGKVGNVAIDRSGNTVSMDESLLASSPDATYSCKDISSTERRCSSSLLSDVSLNSGNIIQTPDSDSSSGACFRRSRLEVQLSNSVWPELDSMAETLERVRLSPRNTSQTSMWDAPVLGSPPISHDPTQLHENVDCVSSWVSDTTTIDNLTLSQMKISWCEGLAGQVVGNDEVDYCCRLSDEEIDGDEGKDTCHGERNNLGAASVENKENSYRIGNEFSPVLLDYEPCFDAGGKGKKKLSSSSSLHRPNACVESICTDGGGLVASDDSDWTYFKEGRSFHVT